MKCSVGSGRTNKNQGKYALLKSALLINKWKIFGLFVVELFVSLAETLQPLLLERVLNYIESDTTEKNEKIKTLIFVVLMLLYILLSRIIKENINYYGNRYEIQLRQALIAMMYSKALKVTPSTNKGFNRGRLVNMIQNDLNTLVFLFDQLPGIFRVPFLVISILVSLYILVGYVVVAALFLALIFTFINYLIAKWAASFQRRWFECIDQRINKINESIDNIKPIKFN